MLVQLAACLLCGTTVASPPAASSTYENQAPGSTPPQLTAQTGTPTPVLFPGSPTTPRHASAGFTPNHQRVAAEVTSRTKPGKNPFFIGLPFDERADPVLTEKWVPATWRNRGSSACRGHWVELKNDKGDSCFAQWTLPSTSETNEGAYVFGDQPPVGPGITISPAVANYLGLDESSALTVSWRFVDDANVRPGAWIRADEQALLLQALNQQIPDKTISPAPANGHIENEQTLYLKAYLLIHDAEQEVAAHQIPEARKDYDRALKNLRAVVAADPGNAGDLRPAIARAQAARDALKTP